tara:strand:+ start:259 stop:639 length:381 start_codon:yes stop_codon:yes gene_type:complete
MKKLLKILTISMILCSNAYAEIYYCTDIDRVGFDGKKEVTNYKDRKFKAEISFNPPSFSSSDIQFTAWIECDVLPGQKNAMSCANSLGEIITFESSASENYFKYNRAQTYGRNDDIIISYGTCEKF